ncbi:nicotinate phosphoribosyltransferase [Brevibacillus fluminis]|uniref:Nicotinate phosphoribosyltransferase n=1 Tax=Brevibacillus fluminis TaxID=511487 RepID=A0A3M8D8T2_9BACL|nr:nicotinate phosphoribosyltransferase [Brevibacillus fluminis]RNB84454.1 nicotinate phosphoribosyltransferase [Brevibacillus fluminis]
MATDQLSLLTDKYQINMMYAHWKNGTHNKKRVFEAYFRRLPFGNGFAVFAGLERIVRYINQLSFSEEEIAYLATQEEQYDSGFLDELRKLSFTGTLRAVPEGTLVFPNEPLIQVEARVFEAQLIETALLTFMNYQTLIATKAARIRKIAPNDILLEFGTRRAQEADAAIWGARAAYLAGFDATSNMKAGMMFGIPTKGTHAHSWVQDHASEEEAFRRFAEALPNQVTLLVDTYDTLKSGIPNAIKVGLELQKKGITVKGIRIDSGDLAYLSIHARQMLDDAGLKHVQIVASNDLDENLILNLKAQGARIDSWGIGTKLITAADDPSLGGVYKVVAKEEDGIYIPTIKISGNPEKISTPGKKKLWRIISKRTAKAEGDYLALAEEIVHGKTYLKLFDPVHTYMHKIVSDYEAHEVLHTIFEDGRQVYQLPGLDAIRAYHRSQLGLFWDEYLRKLNPEKYYVNLSQQVWDIKMKLIQEHLTTKRQDEGRNDTV